MSTRLVFALLLCVIITSCSKSNLLSTKQATDEGLAGTWQWLRTDGGIAFNVHDTPQSTGKEVVLQLGADGRFAYVVNNIETASGTYTLETRTCIHDGTQKTFVNLSGCPGFMIEKLEAQRLETSDENYDGVGSEYARVSQSVK